MRILSVVGRSYYGQPHAIEPMFVEFTDPLRRMGHSVSHFDHIAISAKYGPDRCGATFVNEVRPSLPGTAMTTGSGTATPASWRRISRT